LQVFIHEKSFFIDSIRPYFVKMYGSTSYNTKDYAIAVVIKLQKEEEYKNYGTREVLLKKRLMQYYV